MYTRRLMSIYKVYSIGPTWSWPVMLPRLVQELNDRYHCYVETSVEVSALVKEFEAKYLSDVEEAYTAAVKL